MTNISKLKIPGVTQTEIYDTFQGYPLYDYRKYYWEVEKMQTNTIPSTQNVIYFDLDKTKYHKMKRSDDDVLGAKNPPRIEYADKKHTIIFLTLPSELTSYHSYCGYFVFDNKKRRQKIARQIKARQKEREEQQKVNAKIAKLRKQRLANNSTPLAM